MTKYASALFAFAAAITGVIGDTHNSIHPGITGITALGWVAILVATLSFVVILIETYRDHTKISWQAQQRAKVRRIANDQVAEAVMYLLNPFRVLLTELWQKQTDFGIDLEQLDKDAGYIINQLSKPKVRAEFDSIDLRAKPNVAPPILWWEYFAESASKARELLNQAVAKYSGYIDPDAIVAIEQVRADEVVYFRLPELGELESSNSHIVPLPLSYAFGFPKEYDAFDIMLKKLQVVVDQINSERSTA